MQKSTARFICVRSVNIPETPCTPNWFLSKRFIAESHICERLATRFLPVFREKGISKNFSISLSITTLNVSRFLSRENSHKQYESYQIGCFRLSLPVISIIPRFFFFFFCAFFSAVSFCRLYRLLVIHTENMSLEPTCKSLPRRGLESSANYFSKKTT